MKKNDVASSQPQDITGAGANWAYFDVYSPTISVEPYASNGTPAGTMMVKDIRPDAASSSPSSFAVYKNGSVKLVDQVKIDLKRYGTPKIDQHKVVVAPTARAAPSTMEAKAKHGIAAKADTTAASRRLESQRPPGKGVHAVPARKRAHRH